MRSWWNLPRYFWHPLTLLHKNAACSRDWLNNSTPALLEGSHWKLSSASWGTCIAYTWHHFALLRSLLAICPWILPMVSLLIYAHLISFQSQAWSCTQGDWGTSHFNHQSVRHVCKQTQILMTQLQHYNILHLYPLKRTTILEAKNIWGYMGKISWASTNFNQFQPISPPIQVILHWKDAIDGRVRSVNLGSNMIKSQSSRRLFKRPTWFLNIVTCPCSKEFQDFEVSKKCAIQFISF